MATDKSPDEYNNFVSGADPNTHSSQQGLQVYLTQFENFSTLDAGKFSTSGTTIGEIKLFATLQILILVKADVLQGYPKLSAFMETLGANEQVKAATEMLASTSQYFVPPPN